MDPRVEEHARLLVEWSARIEPGDRVIVEVDAGSVPLGEAVVAELAGREASVLTTFGDDAYERAYLTGLPEGVEPPTDPDHVLAAVEAADAVLRLRGGHNASELADVPAERLRSAAASTRGVREARYRTKWVSTVHPTASLAQRAGMSTPGYRDFAYRAMLRDWESLAAEMAVLKERLDAGSTVHLEAPRTDLRLGIEGRTAVNSAASVAYDSHNLPSGEVFTAPADAEGTVTFDVPMTIRGSPVRDVSLTFEDGEVVDADAGEGLQVVEGILETDAGARRPGEFGVGMNRGIDRYTNNILFDEKMGGTVHLALGRAYAACLPPGEAGNDSAVHVDLIADVTTDATMRIDGELVQRDGRFVWEG